MMSIHRDHNCQRNVRADPLKESGGGPEKDSEFKVGGDDNNSEFREGSLIFRIQGRSLGPN